VGARVLVTGVSTRAAAESAARAGFAVTALDAFGDLDQHAGVRGLAMPRDFGARFTPGAAARASRSVEVDAVAYLSSYENRAGAVRALAAGRALWGNPPSVLARVRDPIALADALRARGCAAPRTRAGAPAADDDARGDWLLKPRASGGGQGVRAWRRGEAVPGAAYLQERIDGTPASIVFVAAAGRVVPLALSRQLVGDAAFGASGFRYCGSVLAAAGDPQLDDDEALFGRAVALAGAVADEYGLVGVNGVDFVARRGVPYAIEVNPRYCASMELAEREYGVSVFGAHAAACAGGALPAFDLAAARRGAAAAGKAVLFARRAVRAGDTRPWLADPTVRDVPHPGEWLAAGQPVCTVFAAGADAAACHAALVRRAEAVYAELDAWGRAAP
jgi:predicted ATP-grasp superfamily ATP-dependent carboligase